MREETLILTIAPNEGIEPRLGAVGIVSGEAIIETVQIYQNSLNKSVPLRLLPDKSLIEQGDMVTFAVVLEGHDVTPQARILNLNTGEYLSGNTYHAASEGTVEFMAEYDGLTPRKAAVSTNDFLKRTIIFSFYGTWCAPSYQMDTTTTRFMENYPDILDKITIHIQDNFSNINSAEFVRYFGGINSIPVTFTDINTRIMAALGYADLEREALAAAARYAPAGLAVATDLKDKILEVTVEATAAVEGEYSLGVMLSENGLAAPQTGSGSDEYIHNNVFRKNLSTIPGESLGFFGINEQRRVTYRTDISAYKAENCEIVCYLYTRDGEVLQAVNSARCRAGEYTGYRFAD